MLQILMKPLKLHIKLFRNGRVCLLKKRSKFIIKLSEAIEKRMDEFVKAESLDNGKPIALAAQVDIPRAVSNFHFCYGNHTFCIRVSRHGRPRNQLHHEKTYCVVGCISPWNLPLYLFSWKIAPALASGNCVIAKPSEVTPYTAYLLSEVAQEIGLPPGVLNIIHGTGPSAGDAIVVHTSIKAISFTGGTQTGAYISRTAGPMFKKLSLNLVVKIQISFLQIVILMIC